MTSFRVILFIIGFTLLLSGCDSGTPGTSSSGNVEDVDTYLNELPAWSEFSPPKADAGGPTGDAVKEAPITVDVDSIGDDGEVYNLKNVEYQCETQPYSITRTPGRDLVMYNPSELLWPGALLQGKSHTIGSISDLSISGAERAPLNVSLNVSTTRASFRTVEEPTKSVVRDAVSTMVGEAVQDGIATPSSIAFELRTYHSEQQTALEMGLSGRYLGYSASARGSIERQASETTVTAHYYQNMYEVEIDNPPAPGDVFSEVFTEQKLQELQRSGEIGPDNLPIYVSKIIYGRMMMFSITSTASRNEIEAAMNAAYDGIGSGGSASLDAKQKKILEEAKVEVTSIGGDGQNVIDVIRSGNWRDYFTENAPLSTAAPLSYTFRNLGDNSIAKVTEATDYEIRTCTATQASPGTFDLRNAETLYVPISTPFSTTTADVDGDGSDDLVFNHLGATNEVAIAFANGDGTFASPQVQIHPDAPSSGWADSDFVTADLEDDGSYELVWSRVDNASGANRTYVARASGRSLAFLDAVPHPDTPTQGGGWDQYRTLVGDMDGDGDDDLVWNLLGDRNRTFVGFSNGDGTFSLPTTSQNQGSTWFPYEAFVGDVTNDTKADMIWSVTTDSRNGWYVGESLIAPNTDPGENGYFDLAFDSRGGTGWDDYVTIAGDIDGRNGTDLLFINPTYPGNRTAVHRSLSDGAGSFTSGVQDFLPSPVAAADIRLADVTGEGRSDLVAFDRSNPSIYVGLGTENGVFDFSRAEQALPQDDWSQFTPLTGDFNGDRLQDVLWINEAPSSRVYVGLARQDDAL
ncbi:thiol-activated cytolysin family protein [Longibacter sp.]|jgi:hypothetical protein|uniref:thiol-activated cytolysin family protein n=1 Tax=Longibacter sp. TaxID=2045415 RepID=UPI003EBB065C